MNKVVIVTNSKSEGLLLDALSFKDKDSFRSVVVLYKFSEFIKYYLNVGRPNLVYVNAYTFSSYISFLICLFFKIKVVYHIHDPLPFGNLIKKYGVYLIHFVFARLSFRVVVYGRYLKLVTSKILVIKPSKIIWAYPPIRNYGSMKNFKNKNIIVTIGRPSGYKSSIISNKFISAISYNRYLNDEELSLIINSSQYIGFNYSQFTMMSAMPASVLACGAIPLFFSKSFIREPFARKQDLKNIDSFYNSGDEKYIMKYICSLSKRLDNYKKDILSIKLSKLFPSYF